MIRSVSYMDFGLRLTAYGLRLTAYGLRLTAHGSRLTAFGILLLTASGVRLPASSAKFWTLWRNYTFGDHPIQIDFPTICIALFTVREYVLRWLQLHLRTSDLDWILHRCFEEKCCVFYLLFMSVLSYWYSQTNWQHLVLKLQQTCLLYSILTNGYWCKRKLQGQF